MTSFLPAQKLQANSWTDKSILSNKGAEYVHFYQEFLKLQI